MCNFEKGFILCTCKTPTDTNQNKNIISSDLVKTNKADYVWTLSHYLGENVSDIMGSYSPPSHDIGNALTSQFVIQELNAKNCFDFPYQPSEGDYLVISHSKDYARLALIYRENNWVEDHYDPFSTKTEGFNNGIVKEKD